MFKLQSPSKYSSCDAIPLSRRFCTAQNSFWTHRFWCLIVLLPFFVSPLPHQQNVSLWGLFSFTGKQKTVAGDETGWVRKVGHEGHAIFYQKLLGTQCSMSRYTCKSPNEMVKHHFYSFCWKNKKKFTEAKCSVLQRQLVYTLIQMSS